MIDDFSILLSTLLCIYVTWRAYKLSQSGMDERAETAPPVSTLAASPPASTWNPDWDAMPKPPDRPGKWDDALL